MADLQKIEDCSRISVNRRIPSKLLKARLQACRVWPFSRDAILSMAGIPVKGLGTMSVDKYWRLYFDPRFVEESSDKELAACILHELLHLLYYHHKRGTRILGISPSSRERYLMNVAADAQINDLLREEIDNGRRKRHLSYYDIQQGDDWIFPETVNVTPNTTMEETYRELQSKEPDEIEDDSNQGERGGGASVSMGQEGGDRAEGFSNGTEEISNDHSLSDGDTGEYRTNRPGDDNKDVGDGREGIHGGESDSLSPQGSDSNDGEDGAGTDGSKEGTEPSSNSTGQLWSSPTGELEWHGPHVAAPGTGASGSSADGLTRPWELPEPTESNKLPGLDETHSDSIINEVAKQLQSSPPGTAGGSLTRWANKARRIHKDPREVILRVVRKRVEEHTGIGERSFRRPNRRYAHSGVVMPSNVAVVPRIAIFLDTSGSMCNEDFSLALGMINKIISSFRIRDGIVIITGDTEAKTKMHTAGQVRELELKGGGGTDVGNIVSTGIGELRAKPHIAVAITDGMTPWPESKSDVGVPILAVITRPKDDGGYYKVPDWIETIYLKD